jgi:hypothetical protein
MVQRATNNSYKEFRDMVAIVVNKHNPRKTPSILSYLNSMYDMYNARPFISDGGYVGLCPDVSAGGDEIYIPFGSHVPFTFRKMEDGC